MLLREILLHVDPRKVTGPRESTDLEVVTITDRVLECLVRDDIDDGTDDSLTILTNRIQQRFQPSGRALAVGVLMVTTAIIIMTRVREQQI